jgi:hypothetical protein
MIETVKPSVEAIAVGMPAKGVVKEALSCLEEAMVSEQRTSEKFMRL